MTDTEPENAARARQNENDVPVDAIPEHVVEPDGLPYEPCCCEHDVLEHAAAEPMACTECECGGYDPDMSADTEPITVWFTCSVCKCQSAAQPDDADIADEYERAIADGKPIVCNDCISKLAAGVCGHERMDYACLREPGHELPHVTPNGAYLVMWMDEGNGVKMRKRAEQL